MAQHNSSYLETEEKLFRSFLVLLQEKMPDKITATDMIRTSGIHKSTFYDHYKGGITDYYNGLKQQVYEEIVFILKRLSNMDGDVALFHQLRVDVNSLFPIEIRLKLMRAPYFLVFLQEIEQHLIRQFQSHTSQSGEDFWRTAAVIRSSWYGFLGSAYYLFRHIDEITDDEASATLRSLAQLSSFLLEHSFPEALEPMIVSAPDSGD